MFDICHCALCRLSERSRGTDDRVGLCRYARRLDYLAYNATWNLFLATDSTMRIIMSYISDRRLQHCIVQLSAVTWQQRLDYDNTTHRLDNVYASWVKHNGLRTATATQCDKRHTVATAAIDLFPPDKPHQFYSAAVGQ